MKEIPKPSVRGEKRDDLHEDHIRTARAKGLREQVVI
jgi:ABC-type dipeptide/oligopeptide/nickel transport system permease component